MILHDLVRLYKTLKPRLGVDVASVRVMDILCKEIDRCDRRNYAIIMDELDSAWRNFVRKFAGDKHDPDRFENYVKETYNRIWVMWKVYKSVQIYVRDSKKEKIDGSS